MSRGQSSMRSQSGPFHDRDFQSSRRVCGTSGFPTCGPRRASNLDGKSPSLFPISASSEHDSAALHVFPSNVAFIGLWKLGTSLLEAPAYARSSSTCLSSRPAFLLVLASTLSTEAMPAGLTEKKSNAIYSISILQTSRPNFETTHQRQNSEPHIAKSSRRSLATQRCPRHSNERGSKSPKRDTAQLMLCMSSPATQNDCTKLKFVMTASRNSSRPGRNTTSH